MLIESINTERTIDGINTIDGWNLKNALESFTTEPSDAFGAGIPRPMNERNASAKIAPGIENVIMMMICPITFGIK